MNYLRRQHIAYRYARARAAYYRQCRARALEGNRDESADFFGVMIHAHERDATRILHGAVALVAGSAAIIAVAVAWGVS